MSVSGIASLTTADAVYTQINLATATSFAAIAPLRRQVEKDIRSEDVANRAALSEPEEIAATEAALTFRRNNERDRQRKRKRGGPLAKLFDADEDEDIVPGTFDSYA